MSQSIQGLGWFLRRTKDPIKLGKFYERAIGLPLLRSWKTDTYAGAMMWAGGVCVLETNLIGPSPMAVRKESPCIPVFRTHNLAASRDRVRDAGASFARREEENRAETEFYLDIDGFPFGLEQIRDASLFREDQTALDAWGKKPRLADTHEIEGDIQGISRVIQLTHNPATDAQFLTDRFGMKSYGELNGSIMMSLGEEALLELRLSETKYECPTSRENVPDTWILREYDHQSLLQNLKDKGDLPIESLVFDGGDLDYFVLPSNLMFGLQERRVFNPDVKATQAIEDGEFRKNWERKAAMSE